MWLHLSSHKYAIYFKCGLGAMEGQWPKVPLKWTMTGAEKLYRVIENHIHNKSFVVLMYKTDCVFLNNVEVDWWSMNCIVEEKM